MTHDDTHSAIRPFRIAISDEALTDLHDRLARTRWPSEVAGHGWKRGVPLAYLRGLTDYWRTGFDWRKAEAALNTFPQFVTDIDGETLHFLHVPSPRADATPLVLLHGWPGSFVEFAKMIAPLTDPEAHGGEGPAFEVIVPSLPGFGFSGPLRSSGWTVERMASAIATLMQRLGHTKYVVHGGDTGAMVARALGIADASHVEGVHVVEIFTFETPEGEPRDDDERRSREARARYEAELSGYMYVQSQSPQTLAYALNDSPVGQLAWIVEIVQGFSHTSELPEEAVDRDQLLTNVSLYWFTETAGSSSQIYAEASEAWGEPQRCDVPVGVAVFPYDPLLTVRHLVEPINNIVHWTTFDRGGHFAAMEEPDLLVADLRTFVRGLRR